MHAAAVSPEDCVTTANVHRLQPRRRHQHYAFRAPVRLSTGPAPALCRPACDDRLPRQPRDRRRRWNHLLQFRQPAIAGQPVREELSDYVSQSRGSGRTRRGAHQYHHRPVRSANQLGPEAMRSALSFRQSGAPLRCKKVGRAVDRGRGLGRAPAPTGTCACDGGVPRPVGLNAADILQKLQHGDRHGAYAG
jgi:hypothetical protein